MKHFKLLKDQNRNLLEEMADSLVNIAGYSDTSVEYPSFENLNGVGLDPEDFYKVYDREEFSELVAILMYTKQQATFEEIGELMMGIGLVEMQHYDKLGDFLTHITGIPQVIHVNQDIDFGGTPKQALEKAIRAERLTIKYYEEIRDKYLNIYNKLGEKEVRESINILIALPFINKLLADELVHLSLLKEAYSKYKSTTITIHG